MLLLCDLDAQAPVYFINNNQSDAKTSPVCPCRLKGKSHFPLAQSDHTELPFMFYSQRSYLGTTETRRQNFESRGVSLSVAGEGPEYLA